MRQKLFMNRGGLLELFEIAARLNCPEQRHGKAGFGICSSQEVRNGGSILAAKVQLHAEQVCAVRVEIRRLRDHARPRRDAWLEVTGNDARKLIAEAKDALDPEVLNPDAVAALAYLADLVGAEDEPAGGDR